MGSIRRQLLTFFGVLAVLYTGGIIVGQFLDDERPGHGGGHGATASTPTAVRGLSVAADGLRVVVDNAELPAARTAQLRFRIVDADGRAVRAFDVEHTKRMHLIVVRRDLTGFRHLHPRMDASGTWSTPVRLAAPGSYRLLADFVHQGKAATLASDLRVDGTADLKDLPESTDVATSNGGYEVRLDAPDAGPGEEAKLKFEITRGGRPVEVESYLGAGGHLVALREGDLAFLHVHPTEDAHTGHAESIGFAATFPTAGRYRLFLQFQVGGRVQTVGLTHEVST